MSPDMTALVVVLTTVPTGQAAEAIAGALVEERLAACVSLQAPMVSVYRWRDGVERATEHQLVIKTTAGRLGEVRERVLALHPYELPEWIVLNAGEAGPDYLDWVKAATAPSTGSRGAAGVDGERSRQPSAGLRRPRSR